MSIEINRADLYALLACSLRYAMGRRSYVVSEMDQIIREHSKHLTSAERKGLIQDIERQARYGYGDSCDEATWLGLSSFLKEQDHVEERSVSNEESRKKSGKKSRS